MAQYIPTGMAYGETGLLLMFAGLVAYWLWFWRWGYARIKIVSPYSRLALNPETDGNCRSLAFLPAWPTRAATTPLLARTAPCRTCQPMSLTLPHLTCIQRRRARAAADLGTGDGPHDDTVHVVFDSAGGAQFGVGVRVWNSL